ncbi:hypothetical protein [Streptomyces nanshensis]|uniref:Uncharacterized protein n=1 Tax=Streptomyces nanshensis TaxID=518642 RepID=A0A1E7LC75_9ACTN|nr:hypothetical protein [Streptomyces nanshensis]OEV13807.1 hypothetical protein AN218_01870 [Streptomyces nanshensis]
MEPAYIVTLHPTGRIERQHIEDLTFPLRRATVPLPSLRHDMIAPTCIPLDFLAEMHWARGSTDEAAELARELCALYRRSAAPAGPVRFSGPIEDFEVPSAVHPLVDSAYVRLMGNLATAAYTLGLVLTGDTYHES